MILKIKPKERTDQYIEVLRLMTKENKFFNSVLSEYGEETYNEMLKYCYVEYWVF
jgi:hypothetical protein